MRITQDLLLKNAEETVTERCQMDKDILAAYLCGSVLDEDAVLGGTADIDLVFIHDSEREDREVLRLTSDVHLDIQHHPKKQYEEPRALRQQPWRGFTLYAARSMYDPEHFLDLAQAAVRGLFDSTDNTYARAYALLQRARHTWMEFHNSEPSYGPQQVWEYLTALENAANAVACLSGPPLVQRRLLLHFPARAEAMRQPGLYAGLLGLLGVGEKTAEDLRAWLPAWKEAYHAVSAMKETPLALHADRQGYYARAIEAMLDSEQAHNAAWPLLHTWAHMALHLPGKSAEYGAWQGTFEGLALTGEDFKQRLAGLDAYLDGIEEMFDGLRQDWGV